MTPLHDEGHARPDVRRRFLKAGLGAGSAILTLQSRPVLGGQCVVTSSLTSLTHASHAAAAQLCSGKTPDSWAAAKTWPLPYISSHAGSQSPTDYIGNITLLKGSRFSDKKMMDVVKFKDDGGMQSLGRYTCAALLNARMGLTPVLNENGVRTMWNDYVLRGYYEPTAGIRWGAPQIIAYIQSTMG